MDENRRRIRDEIRAIEEVLREWDPIEVIEDQRADGVPLSEYDNYAPVIVGMLHRGATEADLASHLRHIRAGFIGLEPNDPSDAAAANQIFRWWEKRQAARGSKVV